MTHRIVIVGGGAGGLELATRLGKSLGKSGKASVVLVDANLTHIWKPLLHEVAAGSLNSSEDELNYVAQAKWKEHWNVLKSGARKYLTSLFVLLLLSVSLVKQKMISNSCSTFCKKRSLIALVASSTRQ